MKNLIAGLFLVVMFAIAISFYAEQRVGSLEKRIAALEQQIEEHKYVHIDDDYSFNEHLFPSEEGSERMHHTHDE